MQTAHASIHIRDLGCAGGTGPLERALREVPGVVDVYVNPVTETAYVEYDTARCTHSQLEVAVHEAGFQPLPHR